VDAVFGTVVSKLFRRYTMTNQSIRALYGSLVAMTLQLDDALTQKLDARGFLPVALVAELAEEHALQYQLKTGACFFTVADNGGYRFYTSEEAISANKHTRQHRSNGIGALPSITTSRRTSVVASATRRKSLFHAGLSV
jgi:hypothetical protein